VNIPESFRIALRALAANKVRSALTMLGVIIGVAAVILLVAIGTGVQRSITGQIEGLGSNLIFVFPGRIEEQQQGGGSATTKQFTMEDAQTLQRRLVGASAVVPIIQAPVTVKYANISLRSTIAAGNESGDQVFSAKRASGRHYNRSEYIAASRVVMLGATPRDKLFPHQNALGKEVSINGQKFRVIATYGAQGGGLGGDQDNQLYMPTTTAMSLLSTRFVNAIIIKAKSTGEVDSIKSQATRLLRPKFGQDFSVLTQEQTLGLLSTILGTLTFMLAGLAGISLLVGGIGIMNIMLVSVSERTREIGIRKAVGARTYDILSQFIIEAVMLSMVGGAMGIAIGAGGAALLQKVVPTAVTPWSVALAFFFSAAVGVFFGVYPAYRASKLDPITALRYE